MKYQVKQVLEAQQWDGEDLETMEQFLNPELPKYVLRVNYDCSLLIESPHVPHSAPLIIDKNDYVVKLADGYLHAFRKVVFEGLYDRTT